MSASGGAFNLAMRVTADVNQGVSGINQTTTAVERLSAATNTATSAAKSMSQEQQASMAKLASAIDPVIAKLEKLDELEASLNGAKSRGWVDDETFADLSSKLDLRRKALTEVDQATSHLSLTSAGAAREIGVLARELVTGNFDRLSGSLLVTANRMGALPLLFSATGAAIAGTTAAVLAFGAAVVIGAEQDAKLNEELIQTGQYAGATLGQIHQMAQAVQTSTGTIGQNRQALNDLVASGRFTADQIRAIGPAAVDMAALTGQSVDKCVAEFVKLAQDPAQASEKLNESWHYLNATVLEQIRTLQQQGQQQEAATLAVNAFADAVETRAPQVTNNAGAIERAWVAVKQAVSGAVDAVENIGRTSTPEDQAARIRGQINGRREELINVGGLSAQQADAQLDSDPQIQKLRQQLAPLQAQAIAGQFNTQEQSLHDQVEAAAAAGLKKLTAEYQAALTPMQKYEQQIKAIDQAEQQAKGGQGVNVAQIEQEANHARQHARDELNKSNAPVDRADLSAQEEATRQALQKYSDDYNNSEKLIESARKAGLASDKDYYAQRLSDINTLEQNQISALQHEADALSTHAANAAERIRINQQVEGINQQIDKSRADAAAKRQELADLQHQNDQRAKDDADKIREAYDQATGQVGDAAITKATKQWQPYLEKAQLNGNQQEVEQIKVVIDTATAEAQINQIKEQIAQIDQGEQGQIQSITANQQAGSISKPQAQQQLFQVYQQTYAQLAPLVEKANELGANIKDPAIQSSLLNMNKQFQDLGNTLSPVTAQVENVFGASLNSVLDQAGTKITNVKQSLQQLGLSLVQGVQRIAAQQVSDQATTWLKGGLDQVSSWFGGASGTVAQVAGAASGAGPAAAATSLATAGTTTATAIGTAATDFSASVLQAGEGFAQLVSAAGGSTGAGTLGLGNLSGADDGDDSSTDLGGFGSYFGSLTKLAGIFGFDEGGYTGHGPKHQVAGIVHAGEVVFSQDDVARHGGVHAVEAMRKGFPGYMSGGVVTPMGAPRLGPLAPNSMLNTNNVSPSSFDTLKLVHLWDRDQAAQEIAKSPHFEKAVLTHVSNNPSVIKQAWKR